MRENQSGSSADLRTVLEAVEARNVLLNRLVTSVDNLSRDVRELRREIDARPTKGAEAHRRRRLAALLLLYGVIIIWGHDNHVQHCSPGAQSQRVLAAVAQDARDRPLTPRRLERIAAAQQPTSACDLTFPMHGHDPAGEDWPTRWNWYGFAMYGTVGGILWLWQRQRPNHRHRYDERG